MQALGDRYTIPTSKFSLLIRGTENQTEASGVSVVEDSTSVERRSSFPYKATPLPRKSLYKVYPVIARSYSCMIHVVVLGFTSVRPTISGFNSWIRVNTSALLLWLWKVSKLVYIHLNSLTEPSRVAEDLEYYVIICYPDCWQYAPGSLLCTILSFTMIRFCSPWPCLTFISPTNAFLLCLCFGVRSWHIFCICISTSHIWNWTLWKYVSFLPR